eukprot:CAMPEP_0176445352 /NCGR_PEP_ID=MMETSP0127-20121128/23649_1 /TAXON_ID=938130 /ORGANISM="Platyophrya macrostoma, Strain WH" /LENGTH=185 /DNA_ID=CAMNT_0017831119 /DNA_START=103 /DNA_END=660 /DNA_ORIENTATION=+
MDAGKHLLHRSWTLWYDSKKTLKGNDWESSLVHINTIGTVEDFWVMYNHIKKPSMIEVGANYHFFRQGVKPMWEDSVNQNGGKWVFTLTTKEDLNRMDTIWEDMILSAIGEYLDDGDAICGLVLGKRKTQTKISIWTNNKEELEALARIGKNIRREAKLEAHVTLEFYPHRDGTGAEFPSSILKG